MDRRASLWCVLVAVVLLVAVVAWRSLVPSDIGMLHGPGRPTVQQGKYQPSELEVEYVNSALHSGPKLGKLLQIKEDGEICHHMLDRLTGGSGWRDKCGDRPYPPPSNFQFNLGDGPVLEPIEPLVGLLRSPYGTRPEHFRCCVWVEDRGYIVPRTRNNPLFDARFPGKRYLFDAGCNFYRSGLAWFVDRYRSENIEFDEIYAWESKVLNQQDFWANVPADVVPKLHFYNIPVTTDPGHHHNPIDVMFQVAKPGDFVAIKIDFESPEMEQELLRQLFRHKQFKALDPEIYYEFHYNHTAMHPYGWSEFTPSLQDAYRFFVEARAKNIRVHAWP